MKPSGLEMQILSVLWERGPSTAREVLENMPDGKERAYTSILSVMQQMDKKGLLKRSREGVTDRWRPAKAKKSVMGQYLGDLVQKICGGKPANAVLHLLENTKVNESELEEIEKVIKDYRERTGK